VKVGDRLQVDILGIAHGGHCVARHEGQVIFVRHSIPGEKVVIEITDMSSKFARGDAIEIISASPDRISPRCSYAKPRGCGGCDFQHISLSRQRRLKSEIVKEQFARIAKMEVAVEVEEVMPTEHWRTRMDFTVSPSRKLALFGARSHELIEIDSCQIADSAINIESINSRKLPAGAKVHVAVGTNEDVAIEIEGRDSRVLVEQEVMSRRFSLAPISFWQSHQGAPSLLTQAVIQYAGAKPGDHIFDLYGGVGLFSAALIAKVGVSGRVTLIENDSDAITDARRNFATEENVEIVEERVERALDHYVRADVVVVDPPRAGLGAKTCAQLVELSPRTIVYVSCDPASLARDSRILVDAGYKLDQIRALDLFPMTQHIECVARFIK
jgi:tRNA/tmRNA/rRNA uracil-C5-methylase (TrmA/RlmC/RlmD family)